VLGALDCPCTVGLSKVLVVCRGHRARFGGQYLQGGLVRAKGLIASLPVVEQSLRPSRTKPLRQLQMPAARNLCLGLRFGTGWRRCRSVSTLIESKIALAVAPLLFTVQSYRFIASDAFCAPLKQTVRRAEIYH
jgi:hypothetical protein